MPVERLAVPQAPTQELRPLRNVWQRVAGFGKKTPELRVVPAQLMPGTVAMFPNTGTKAFDLRDERLSIEIDKVFIHVVCSGHEECLSPEFT